MAKKKNVAQAKQQAAPAEAVPPAAAKLVSLSKEQAEAHAAMQGAVPIPGDILTASSIQLIWAGNDCTIVFSRPRPVMFQDGRQAQFALAEHVAMISCSAATMKDISLLLPEQVAKHEAKYGKIETTYTKSRQAKKQSSAKH